MATKLYLHNALNSNTGIFNQGQLVAGTQYGLAYGNGIYLRSAGTTVQKSTNGIDWNAGVTITFTNTVDIYGLTFGNGYFMVTSSDLQVLRSTDGVTWVTVRTPTAQTIVQYFSYTGSYWFLLCDKSTLSIATGDGTTWTTGDLASVGGATSIYRHAAYNPTTGQYAICATTSTVMAIKFTTDVTGSWTLVSPNPSASVNVKVLGWNTGRSEWTLGTTSQTSNANTFTTPELLGTNTIWTAETIVGAPTNTNWFMINSGSTTIIGGEEVVISSSDGITWTNYNASLIPTQNTIWYTGTYDGTYFYILSFNGIMMRSSNGSTWNRISGPLSNTTESVGTVGSVNATPDSTAYLLKSMNTTIGTLQASLSLVTAPTTVSQNNFMGFFCSEPLSGPQTVGGGTMTLNGADSESNLVSNWWMNGVCVYVWRPSTGTIVGYIRDYQGTPLGGTEPTAAASEQVTNITGITTSAVSAQSQDVIICEIWATATQGMSTAYTSSFYYDGTTENTTENVVVTSQASFIEFAENLTFGASVGNTGNMFMLF